jgi:hypothetical protein
MALLTALFATILLMAMGLSILLLGSGETALSAHDRDARSLAHASRAASAVAIADLRDLPSWAELSTPGAVPELSAQPGRFVDTSLTPAVPWAGPALDLRALTVRLQSETAAAAPAGASAPSWRLFEYGPMATLMPEGGARSPAYLAVWVADDAGVVVTRAVAYGPGEGRSITEVSVARETGPELPGRLRILTVRPGR